MCLCNVLGLIVQYSFNFASKGADGGAAADFEPDIEPVFSFAKLAQRQEQIVAPDTQFIYLVVSLPSPRLCACVLV